MRALRRFDVAFAASIVALSILTIVALEFELSVRTAGLDLVINTIAAVAGIGAAGLAWIRYQEVGERAAVLEGSAFLVLFATRLVLVGVALAGMAGGVGLTLDDPQQWPIYAWTISRAVMALLLILAGLRALDPRRGRGMPAGMVLLLPSAALLGSIVVLAALETQLPIVADDRTFAALRGDPNVMAGLTLPAVIIQAAVAALYLWGAWLHRSSYISHGRLYSAYVAVALVVAAFSQLQWAIRPGIYTSVVTADDLLRLAFSIILLVGIEAQSRADSKDLRRANARLEELRAIEVERSALQARTELAREFHDGLAQDLWFAKLKSGRLADLPELPEDARELSTEVRGAVDRALDQARSALTAIRATADPELGFDDALAEYVADFGSRTGIRATFVADPSLPSLPSRAAAETMRIVMEALSNVQKHAAATDVTVVARRIGATVEVSVADNGSGFAADAQGLPGETVGSFGIRGMRERAVLAGGRLEISSGAGEGTTVTLTIPVGGSATAGGPR